jgi:hypothetical protein
MSLLGGVTWMSKNEQNQSKHSACLSLEGYLSGSRPHTTLSALCMPLASPGKGTAVITESIVNYEPKLVTWFSHDSSTSGTASPT